MHRFSIRSSSPSAFARLYGSSQTRAGEPLTSVLFDLSLRHLVRTHTDAYQGHTSRSRGRLRPRDLYDDQLRPL